jgi:hypothetical protein
MGAGALPQANASFEGQDCRSIAATLSAFPAKTRVCAGTLRTERNLKRMRSMLRCIRTPIGVFEATSAERRRVRETIELARDRATFEMHRSIRRF